MILSSVYKKDTMSNDKKVDKERKEIILWLDDISGEVLIEVLLDECAVDFQAFEDPFYSLQENWMKEFAPLIINATNVLLQLKKYFPDCKAYENHKEIWEACIALKNGEFTIDKDFLETVYKTMGLCFSPFFNKKSDKKKIVLTLNRAEVTPIENKLISEFSGRMISLEEEKIANLLKEGKSIYEIVNETGASIKYVTYLKDEKDTELYFIDKKELQYLSILVDIAKQLKKFISDIDIDTDYIETDIAFFRSVSDMEKLR